MSLLAVQDPKLRAYVTGLGLACKLPGVRVFETDVMTPEYIAPMELHAVLTQAGVLVGLADFRPTFGRFGITSFEVLA